MSESGAHEAGRIPPAGPAPRMRDATGPGGDAGGGGSSRLADLYARFAPDAARLAYLLTGDLPLAEDLAQEAFLRAGGRLQHLRAAEAFEPYLRRTVINLARSHFRRRRVERRYLTGIAAESPTMAEAPSLEANVALRQALFNLPYRQRAAIVLRYYEDLSEQRAAEILRCRPGTVASLVSRGLDRLRAAMARASEEGD